MLVHLQSRYEDDSKLPLTVTGIAFDHRPVAYATVNGFPAFYWFLCRSGTGEICIDRQRSVISKDSGFLICPGTPYSLKQLTEDWSLDCVQFAGPAAMIILENLGMSESGVHHFFSSDSFHDHVMTMYKLYCQKPSSLPTVLSEHCYSFLLEQPKYIRHIERWKGESDQILENRTVLEILNYLETRFTEDISLDEMAEHVGLTKKYICSLFKKEMQRTIVTELTYIRIGHARILLKQHPEKRIAEIAELCGYRDAGYFGKVFQKVNGETPDQYRRKR